MQRRTCFSLVIIFLVNFLFIPFLSEAATQEEQKIAIGNISGELAQQIGEAYQLAGLSDVVRGAMGDKLNKVLQTKLKDFTAQAFEELANSLPKYKSADGKVNVGAMAKDAMSSSETKADLTSKLKQKLRDYIPQATKELVEKELLGGKLLDQVGLKQFGDIERKIVDQLNGTLNDKLDQFGEKWYGEAVSNLNSYLSPCKQGQNDGLCGHLNINVDLTDLKGTFNSAFNLKNAAGLMTYPLANAFGEATVKGIQSRLEDAFNGQLPPEAMQYLKMGPDKFKEYTEVAKKYLPGEVLGNIKAKLFDMPLLKLPNEAYGGILAGVAAWHVAKGLVGCPLSCDWPELQRGFDVARVLVWQLQNKQAVSLTVGNFLDLAKTIGSQFGLDKLSGVTKLKAKWDEVNKKIDDIDKFLKKPLDKANAGFDKILGEFQKKLTDLQGKLLGPLKDIKDDFEDEFKKAQKEFGDLLGDFNGLPGSFDDLKKKLGLPEDLLGKFGELNPYDKAKTWMEKNIGKVAEKILGGKPKLGSEEVADKGVLGPKAEIKQEEKVPNKNPSTNNAFDPVLLHNGEFYHAVTDLKIPGRGLDFAFTRIYKSRSEFSGLLGYNWTHNYAERIMAWDNSPNGKGVTWADAEGKKYFFKEKSEYEPIKTDSYTILPKFESPKGVFDVLYEMVTAEGEQYVLRSQNGNQAVFNAYGLLIAKKDRYGNEIKFKYDDHARMVEAIDTLGRTVKFIYDDSGRIASVNDFTNRTLKYEYSDAGDLVAAYDFAGKATKYKYDAHRITEVTDKKGQLYLRNTYGTVGDNTGKVIDQVYGEDKFHIKAEYRGQRVWVSDKRGVMRVYDHNEAGGLICEWIIENGKAVPIIWHYYDENNQRTMTGYPSGRYVLREFNAGNLLKEQVCKNECRITAFEYESSFNNLVTLKDAADHEYKFEYNGTGALVKFIRPDKGEIKFENDKYGRRISKTSTGGIVDKYEYADYLKKIIKDASGLKATWLFDYDKTGFLTAVTEPGGFKKIFNVDSSGRVISENAKNWNPETLKHFLYDANGNIVKEYATFPNPSLKGGEHAVSPPFKGELEGVEYTYDILDKIILKREKISADQFAETRYEYDANENLTKVVLPEGNSLNYYYDDRDRMVGFGTTKFEYNDDGDRNKVINGVGAVTEFVFNDFGEVVKVKDPIGFVRNIERDTLGRVIAEKTALSESEYIYDVSGNPSMRRQKLWRDDIKDATWVEEKVAFDKDDRLVEIIDGNGSSFKMLYDGLGRVIERKDPLGNSEKYSYNLDGKILKEARGENVTSFSYDKNGNLVSTTDALGNVSKYFYDSLGKLIKETDPAGFSINYQYDLVMRPLVSLQDVGDGKFIRTSYEWNKNGNLAALIDDNGNRTKYFYDEMNRPIKEVLANGTVSEYKYDSAGNLVELKDPSGNQIVNSYDGNGNQLARKINDETIQEFAYDGLSRLVYSSDHGRANIWYTYDSLSRLIAENQNGNLIVRNYDNAGNKTATMYPSQNVVYKNYDPLNRLINVQDIAQYKYTGADRLSAVAFENGVNLSQRHDKLGQVTERRFQNGGQSFGWQYQHDNRNNLISDGENKYGYDGASRLVKSVCHSCESRNPSGHNLDPRVRGDDGAIVEWQLDGVGNWINKYQADEMNQYKGFEYDKNGNLIGDQNFRYKYDGLNRLVQVTKADGTQVASYEYDVHNRRVSKYLDEDLGTKAPKHLSTYFYDGWDLIQENDGASMRQYIYGQNIDEPLALSDGNKKYYYISDRLGSIRGLADESGQQIEKYNYTPYGETEGDREYRGDQGYQATSSKIPSIPLSSFFNFTARELDPETGLIFFRNRYYSPEMGRFISRDPLGYVDGPNRYAYVGNRPLNAVDPLGLFALKYHEIMTQAVFNSYGLNNLGVTATLGNWSSDANNLSSWHFDNLSSPSQIKWNWNDVLDRIDQFKNLPDIKDESTANRVAYNIGQVLHSVQDFYSHSNWVEYWNEKGKYGDQIETYLQKKSDIKDDANLFTGSWQGKNPKCPKSHEQLNKDSPTKWNSNEERSEKEKTKLFDQSANVAQMATDEALNMILNNLGSSNLNNLKAFGTKSSSDQNAYEQIVKQISGTKYYQ